MNITDCLTCHIKLKQVYDGIKGEYYCKKCNDIYLKCHRCEQNGESWFDWQGNDQGCNCAVCNNHFCANCWQNTGGFSGSLVYPEHIEEYFIDENAYLCENCFAQKQKELNESKP